MGNIMGTMLSKYHKHGKPKNFLQKAVSIVGRRHHNVVVDNDVFFRPKSCQSGLEPKEDDDEQVMKTSETAPTFICEICVEPRPLHGSFNPKGCTHFYCTECTVRYVASKLDGNLTFISCPVSGCGGALEPEYCREILPKDVFERWGIALCESVIDGSEKFYCPYNNCSALLINDAEKEILDSLCPLCKRSFCAKCKVPWHSEIDCKKFQRLKKKGEDRMLEDLAQRKKWKRCPKCKYYVEKSSGCDYLKCRCQYAFCYKCGCRRGPGIHVCPTCEQ